MGGRKQSSLHTEEGKMRFNDVQDTRKNEQIKTERREEPRRLFNKWIENVSIVNSGRHFATVFGATFPV